MDIEKSAVTPWARCAVVTMSGQIVAESLAVLIDAGIRITDTLEGRFGHSECVFVIEGEMLPEMTPSGLKQVTFELTREAYGRQHITRITKVIVIGDWTANDRKAA